MAKIYVFGIGGTGSRVIKALTMLLASGVKLEGDISDVIPIIIDPDVANGDMSRTLDMLKLYQDIRQDIENPGTFFGTQIQTLPQLMNPTNPSSPGNFQFKIDGTSKMEFKEFIGKGNLSTANDGLTDLLFSKSNLDASLDIGFKGNPNIGSTVLNQLAISKQYLEFAQSFTPGDKIYIISSIFGGTGAAGFPLLLKNLRSGNPEIPNSADIRDSVIGAISVLPYFNVAVDNNSQIDSDTFFDKAKAALMYYDRTILEAKQLNALYYIGDRPRKSYENHEGNQEQKNDAHFIELASAFAIVDFCKAKNDFKTINGKALNLDFKEFGISGSHNPVTLNSLDSAMQKDISTALSKFKFLVNYMTYGLDKAIGVTIWTKTKTDESFFQNDNSYKNIEGFLDFFNEWLEEMSQNQDVFMPFNLNIDAHNALEFVNGKNPSRKGVLKNDLTYNGLEKSNSECFRNYTKYNATTQFLRMTEESIDKILSERKLI